jgi:quinoprotein glucose dehydrogenase
MQTMCVGGRATHWGAETPRYSPEDFRGRSLTGVGEDWPITYEDLAPYYEEAERRLGVASKPSEEGSDLRRFQEWAAGAGIEAVPTPRAMSEGRAYSPVPTIERLSRRGRVRLATDTLIRRLELEAGTDRVARATGTVVGSGEEVSVSASHFLLAGSYVWTPHLLLLSANSRFPAGLANGSGLVGRYITGHPEQFAVFDMPERLYPGSSLFSRQFLTPPRKGSPTRFGLYLYAFSMGPRVRGADGRILLGDEILDDLRKQRTSVSFKSYLSVTPSPESRLVLDRKRRNRWGDPLPTVNDFANRQALSVWDDPPERLEAVVDRLRRHSTGQVGEVVARLSLHPSGGCRMGVDPVTSVCDGFGRCHDHENLFILGAPTCVTGGCVNSTLTFVALALRSAAEVGKAFPRRTRPSEADDESEAAQPRRPAEASAAREASAGNRAAAGSAPG